MQKVVGSNSISRSENPRNCGVFAYGTGSSADATHPGQQAAVWRAALRRRHAPRQCRLHAKARARRGRVLSAPPRPDRACARDACSCEGPGLFAGGQCNRLERSLLAKAVASAGLGGRARALARAGAGPGANVPPLGAGRPTSADAGAQEHGETGLVAVPTTLPPGSIRPPLCNPRAPRRRERVGRE
jgi:hypothetical protein